VWAVKKYNLYLAGSKFVLHTDHQPLAYLKGVLNYNFRPFSFELKKLKIF